MVHFERCMLSEVIVVLGLVGVDRAEVGGQLGGNVHRGLGRRRRGAVHSTTPCFAFAFAGVIAPSAHAASTVNSRARSMPATSV